MKNFKFTILTLNGATAMLTKNAPATATDLVGGTACRGTIEAIIPGYGQASVSLADGMTCNGQPGVAP